jgi:hypothetical protein
MDTPKGYARPLLQDPRRSEKSAATGGAVAIRVLQISTIPVSNARRCRTMYREIQVAQTNEDLVKIRKCEARLSAFELAREIITGDLRIGITCV